MKMAYIEDIVTALYYWRDRAWTDQERWHINQIIGDLRSLSENYDLVDVPVVVRCEECEFWRPDIPTPSCYLHGEGLWTDESFCSFARKRGEDEPPRYIDRNP